MDIEEMKRNKFKKFMLVVLFAIIVILGLNNSVYAIEIKSISKEKTWNIGTENIDYNLAQVVYNTMNLGSELKKQELPNSNTLKPGYRIGATGGNANTFNWRATIGCVYDNSEFCQMVCIHPSTTLDTAALTTYVQKVLFVSKDQLTLYYTDSLSTVSIKNESKSTGTNSAYFNKILQEAYSAKSSVDAAEHLRHHLADDNFHKTIKNCGITNWELMAGNNFATSCTSNDDGYNYYGIFIFVGTGGNGSQGRIIFDVYREKKSSPISIKVYKRTDSDTALTGAKFTVTFEQSGTTTKTETLDMTTATAKTTEEFTPSNTNDIKVTIKETKTPDHYNSAGNVVLTYKWDTSKKIWKPTVTSGGNSLLSFNEDSSATFYPTSTDRKVRTSDNKEFQVKIKNDYNPPISMTVYKISDSGKGLTGAKFTVTFEQTGTTTKIETLDMTTTGSDYYKTTGEFSPNNKNDIKVTIKETAVPGGYNKADDVVLTYKWDTSKKIWKPTVTSGGESLLSFKEDDSATFYPNATNRKIKTKNNKLFHVKIKNNTRIISNLIINKKDKSGVGAVEDATFKVYFNNITYVKIAGKTYVVEDIIKENKIIDRNGTKYYTKTANGLTLLVPNDSSKDRLYIEGLKTDKNGQIKIDEIEATKNKYTVYVTVTETVAPSGYDMLPEAAKLLLKYNNSGSNKWELFIRDGSVLEEDSKNYNKLDSEYYSLNSDKLTLTLKDDFKIDKLTILKTDSQSSSTKLQGAKFNITLSNVKSVKGYSANTSDRIILTGVTTNANGNIVLEDLVVSNINKPITITIEETQAPEGYKKLEGTITVTLTRSGSTYKVDQSKSGKSDTISDSEFKTDNVKIENNEVVININNIQLITLSGQVWLDKQIEEKKGDIADGIKEKSESRLEGVLVQLYKANDNTQVTQNANGEDISNVKTDAKGNYSFENIEKTSDGYYIKFNYDGINYQETKSIGSEGTDSQADETSSTRQTFNSNFRTISKAQSNNGTQLAYDYGDNKSILRANIDGTNPANDNAEDFRMTAQTGVYKETTENIDCGLVKKEFDLALGTDVKSAELKINDKSTTYNYAQIMNGETDFQNKSSDVSNIIYNLYLYKSDYNYRIKDYKTGNEAINNTLNSDDNTVNNYDNLKELEASVTYSVILKNQTTYDATVNKFVYYYDEIYKPKFKVDDVINGYQVKSIQNNKITFENVRDNKLTNPDYRVEVELEFEVNKNSDGTIQLKDNVTNVAEIIEYSTVQGGLIDKDSAPDNANVTFTNGTPKVGRYEDDTDQAKGISISIRDESRTITGTVFDDGNFNGADGMKQDEEKEVNDVIVQLIEIKKIGGNYYEYIWQETRSGSGTVKKLSPDGNSIKEQNYRDAKNDGSYEFTGFIPGNYIIRFIYGDGTTYDLTDNVKTYNGQDYKSTKDLLYQETWYNDVMHNSTKTGIQKYNVNSSVARDNEARRLEVMAYSSTIDKDIGKALDEKTSLDKTWMCAETSRINVPIDADDKTTASDSTTATYNYTNGNAKVVFDNINFGLALRPETKLVLEKHITGLKITPTGTGVQPIVDAKLKEGIIEILNKNTIGNNDLTGITTGLSTIKSSRDERGFWKVETDIEELAQGAQLEVEYTYVIINKSEEDYMSRDLVENYTTGIENGEYVNYLNTKATEVKLNTKGQTQNYGSYLGEFYYTRNKGENDEEVLSRVEELEEALNNQLKYDETVSGEDFKKINTEAVSKNTYDTDGNLVNNVETGTKNIETVVRTTSTSDFLTRVKENEKYHGNTIKDENGNDKEVVPNTDYSKTLKLTTVLTSFNKGEGYYPSYIAEVVKYSNAAGRRDMGSEPENLSYVHSDDKKMTLETYTYKTDDEKVEEGNNVPDGAEIIRVKNEPDEFWGETIIITKPTGEDKQASLQIAIIAISSIAVLGVGIVLIKKFVLKK